MDNNKTILATFEKIINYYTLRVNAIGKGIVTIDPDNTGYREGSIVTLKAKTTAEKWCFVERAGDAQGDSENIEIVMDSDKVTPRVRIVGNIPPVGVIANGTFEDIDKALKECILKAWNSPKGYTIEAGCQIPYDTPRENLRYYVDRARELSKYPLDFDLLNS